MLNKLEQLWGDTLFLVNHRRGFILSFRLIYAVAQGILLIITPQLQHPRISDRAIAVNGTRTEGRSERSRERARSLLSEPNRHAKA